MRHQISEKSHQVGKSTRAQTIARLVRILTNPHIHISSVLKIATAILLPAIFPRGLRGIPSDRNTNPTRRKSVRVFLLVRANDIFCDIAITVVYCGAGYDYAHEASTDIVFLIPVLNSYFFF